PTRRSYDLVLDEDMSANGASDFKELESVEVIDDYKVEFHLDRPFAALPAYLAFNAEILPEHQLANVDDLWDYSEFNKKEPVGTGPYELDDYTSGQAVTLARLDDYHEGTPNLDTVTFQVLLDSNT